MIHSFDTNKKYLIPVFHLTKNTDIFRNIDLLYSLNIKHVFLISHNNMSYLDLIKIATKIKVKYNDFWIGCNFLDLKELETFKKVHLITKNIDGIWIDNSFAGINLLKAEKIKPKDYKEVYFGGVAFKYCPQPVSLKTAIEDSIENIDIITTSGPGTGKEADLNKIKTIFTLVNNRKPIALASGITNLNIEKYLQYVNIFMVGTFIEDSNGNFIEENLIKLLNLINKGQ